MITIVSLKIEVLSDHYVADDISPNSDPPYKKFCNHDGCLQDITWLNYFKEFPIFLIWLLILWKEDSFVTCDIYYSQLNAVFLRGNNFTWHWARRTSDNILTWDGGRFWRICDDLLSGFAVEYLLEPFCCSMVFMIIIIKNIIVCSSREISQYWDVFSPLSHILMRVKYLFGWFMVFLNV